MSLLKFIKSLFSRTDDDIERVLSSKKEIDMSVFESPSSAHRSQKLKEASNKTKSSTDSNNQQSEGESNKRSDISSSNKTVGKPAAHNRTRASKSSVSKPRKSADQPQAGTSSVYKSERSPTHESAPVSSRKRKIPHTGISAQLVGVDRQSCRGQKQLVIGLDFGTAFTKVVVGEDRFKLSIPLSGPGDDISHYLCPTLMWRSPAGAYSLEFSSGQQIADLKMALIDGVRGIEAQHQAAIYLAYILRRVRSFVFNEKRSIYEGIYINWLINVGLPTDNYHDVEMKKIYQEIIHLAWNLSLQNDTLTDSLASKIARENAMPIASDAKRADWLHDDSVNLFPEFAAQVNGYVRSPLRQPGLHALIDIGAGTLDITSFNVHETEDGDLFPIFAKKVEKLGTRFLVRHRIGGSDLQEEGTLSPFCVVPDTSQFLEMLDVDEDTLKRDDEPFRAKVVSAISQLLAYTKRKRDPRSPKWQSGVPVFLCGGGSHCDFYLNAIFPKRYQALGFPVNRSFLPKPDDLEGRAVDAANYDRLSVAYGLSYDPFDIGEVREDSEIEDYDVSAVGAVVGTVCPRCGGDGNCTRCGGRGFI